MPSKKIDFEKQKKDKLLRANIAHNMELYGVKRKQDIADRLRISRQSLHNKLSNPDTFTRGELLKIFEFLHFTPEQRQECL